MTWWHGHTCGHTENLPFASRFSHKEPVKLWHFLCFQLNKLWDTQYSCRLIWDTMTLMWRRCKVVTSLKPICRALQLHWNTFLSFKILGRKVRLLRFQSEPDHMVPDCALYKPIALYICFLYILMLISRGENCFCQPSREGHWTVRMGWKRWHSAGYKT